MNDRSLSALVLGLFVAGCIPVPEPGLEVDAGDAAGDRVDVGADVTEQPGGCHEETAIAQNGDETVMGVGDCEVVLRLTQPAMTEVISGASARLETAETAGLEEPGWLAPRLLEEGDHLVGVRAEGEWSVTVKTYGTPVERIVRERSLVWTDPELLDDPDVVGLGRLMNVAADGEDGGEFFADWFRRFSTTAHSERVGPLQFLEELEQTHGADPSLWDLDTFPFTVTGVHNRTDLADEDSCGELRVSLASTHGVFQPFHAIFLFDQAPLDGDTSPAGVVHCGATLRRWARLSELDDDAFYLAALQMLDDRLRPEYFLMAETVEFIISPWEWRQWLPTSDADSELERVFENPPLFQTVDTPRLNEPGPARDEFLQFVEENAAELDARTLLLPQQFRPRSARVNAGVPWIPLELDGIDPAVTDAFGDLRRNIEMVGCPACHATDADFIQTRPDRTFSPFYDKELDARADYLDAAHRGESPAVPFGPLQESPVLPP